MVWTTRRESWLKNPTLEEDTMGEMGVGELMGMLLGLLLEDCWLNMIAPWGGI